MNPERELSRYVQVDVSPPRVARIWQAIAARIEPAPSRVRRFLAPAVVLGVLGAVGAVSTIWLRQGSDPASVWQNAALETAGDSLSVRLEDSSRLELARETRVELSESAPDVVRLRLRRGSIRCDVTHREGRRFSIEALGMEVRVIGTLFSVAIADERRVDVAVERGSVEVRALDDTGPYRRISAGERWSVDLPTLPATASSAKSEATAPAPAASDEGMRPAKPRDDAVDARGEPDRPESATAPELFDLANLARRSGDLAAAARAYEALLSKYPNDARVGLAAFELGRLRLERLGNPSGAISALEKAMAHAPSPGLREDAMARLVQAYGALGDFARCRRARDQYLARYPDGVHTNAVKARCADR